MKTTVVNLYKEDYDIYIGGPGRDASAGYFGNPFAPLLYAGEIDRAQCLALYERYFKFRIKTDPGFVRRLQDLRGKRLGCFCAPQRCHGDVIVSWLERNVK